MTRSRMIIVGGSVGLVLMLALSWLLVLAPRLGQPAEIQTQIESVESQTARLNAEVARLQAFQADLPAHIAQFTELRENFPTTAEIPATLDQIRTAAIKAGVTVDALETGVPTILAVEGGSAAPSGEEAATTQGTAATGTTGAEAGTGVPSAASSGQLGSMPVSVTVRGSYSEAIAFLRQVEDLPRAWLITTVTTQAGEGSELTLTLSGDMYVVDTTGVEVPASPQAAATQPGATTQPRTTTQPGTTTQTPSSTETGAAAPAGSTPQS